MFNAHVAALKPGSHH